MRNVLFLVSILLSSSVAPGSVEQQQQQRQEQARTEPEAAPTPLRVVGQAQTQEESDAWMAVQGAANLEEKARLAQDFLARYSESGLSGFAHQMLAAFFQQANDYENFVHHAEKTLEDLPNDLLILSALAVAYAHRGQPEKAIARGLRALQGLEAARKPGHRKASEWFMQKDQLLADANYALGSSHLQLYERDKTGENSRQNLTLAKATRYLQKAVELDPSYDLAYFRLAFAHVKQDNASKGITNYARAVSLNGVTASMAHDQLRKVYEFVYKNTEGLEELIAREGEFVQERLIEQQVKLQELEQQSTAPKTSPGEPATPPQP